MAVAEPVGVVAAAAGAGATSALPLSSLELFQVHAAEVHQVDMYIQSSVKSNWNTASVRRTAIYVLINVQRNKKIRANQSMSQCTAWVEIPIGGSIRFLNTNIGWRTEVLTPTKITGDGHLR